MMTLAQRKITPRPYVAIPARREWRDVELQARAVEMKRQRALADSGFEVVQ